MDREIEELFHELADVAPADRDKWFSAKRVAPEVRAEVEALLRFDSQSQSAITDSISDLAENLLETVAESKLQSLCGPYRLIRVLGRGGMGTVYLAERADGEVEQLVAIKLLGYSANQHLFLDRFLQERQILARLSHPGIAGLLDAGRTADGQPYLAMDYVDGIPIDVFAADLGLQEKLSLFVQVCEAVSFAHHNLVVHRDIKPSNILVDRARQPKLLDFGIAKLLDSDWAVRATQAGEGALTPEYAAPEQVTNGAITTATDVYSLGVLLYVLLTGQHPAGTESHSYADLIKALVETEPLRISSATRSDKLRRQFRGDLDTIVAKALKKNPQERYASATQLADDIRRYLRYEPISVRPDTVAYRATKFVRRNRLAVALGTVALMASIAGVVATVSQANATRLQRDFALRELLRAEAINDLNSFVLSDAAPSGRPFTVNKLLERAEHIVGGQRPENNTNRVDLLIAIGRQYRLQDEDEKSRRVLEEAYKLSRGLSNRSTRANASCSLGALLGRGLDQPRAELLVQEGVRELSDDPLLALDRIHCLLSANELASEQGEAQKSIALVQEAQRLLRQSPFRSDLEEFKLLSHLASAYRMAGKPSDASDAFREASLLLASLGREDTQTAGSLYNNWGLTLYQLGRPLEAEKRFRQAIAISSSGEGEQSVSPVLLINCARTLRDLARFVEAADFAERGHAEAKRAGDQRVITQALLLQASIYRGLGDLTHSAKMLSEVEPRLRRDLPAGHYAFASLMLERALLSEARGDLHTALDLTNQAIALLESSVKAGREGSFYLTVSLIRRSDLELRLGRAAHAAVDAARAVEMLERAAKPVTFSCDLGRAKLALGRALQAQGKHDEAAAALRSAAEHLEQTLGPDHPDTRNARQLMDAATQHH